MTESPTWLRAAELNATHIGEMIRFETDLKPNPNIAGRVFVHAVVTVELRQIGHSNAETHLTVGEGAETEFTLTSDHIVVLNPAEDYADWELFTASDLRLDLHHDEFYLDPEEKMDA